jgi:DNA-binding response OmpR family regulator
MRVLLVEDDELLGDGLQRGLRQHGFTVDWLTRGDEADTALRTQSFEALVLDWQLPGQTGVALLRQLRARGDHTPVLMLTARDTVPERIEGLDAGADDYLVKPVALAELAARLRALHRRAMGRGTPQLQWGALILDPAQHQVTLDGQPVALAPREFALLARLMAQPQRPLSQAQLIEALYAWGEDIASNAVEVHVHHLRRKLGSDWIKTIRGVGYVLNPERARP